MSEWINIAAIRTGTGEPITGWRLLEPFATGLCFVLFGLALVVDFHGLATGMHGRNRRAVSTLVGAVFAALGLIAVLVSIVEGIHELAT
ncbi:hypothetical protein ACFV3E_16735 [Streptomyces sp. NPDC059718]